MATGDRERELRRGVLAGDEAAWRALYDAAFEPLAGYVAWRCAGLADLADEVVQETWLIAVRRIRSFDPAAGSFLAWLRGIAANVVANRLRHGRRDFARRLAGDVSAADDADHRERAEQIAVALASLPRGTRPCCGRSIWSSAAWRKSRRRGASRPRRSSRC